MTPLIMIHYLYYKLYRVHLKSSYWDIADKASAMTLAGLLYLNVQGLLSVLIAMRCIQMWPDEHWDSFVILAVMMFLSLTYFRSSRVDTIVATYSDETEAQRKRGNIALAMYVAITIIEPFVTTLVWKLAR
jgi:hypothetical protein